jgi:hypothetical protein
MTNNINFENFDKKINYITNTIEWKKLCSTFNEKKNIILFGHGGQSD